MSEIEFEGKTYVVPDDLPKEEQLGLVLDLAGKVKEGAQVPSKPAPIAPGVQEVDYKATKGNSKIDPSTLQNDEQWLSASRTLYKKHYGVDFDGSNKDLTDYGLNQMGWFNYNLPAMAVDAVRMKYAKPEEKKAFLYLMDTYDNLELSWDGVGRFLKGAALDPTSYVGLPALGIKFAAGAASETLGKAAIRSAIVSSIEGSIQGGVSSAVKQTAEINAGRGEEIDMGRVAGDAAITGALSGVLGAGISSAGRLMFGRKSPSGWLVEPSGKPGEHNADVAASRVADHIEHATEGPHIKLGSRLETAARNADTSPTPRQDANIARNATISDPAERVLKAIDDVNPSIMEAFSKSIPDQNADGLPAAKLLSLMTKADIENAVVPKLITAKLDPAKRTVLHNSVKQATDEWFVKTHVMWARYESLPDGPDKAEFLKQLMEAEKIRDNIRQIDLTLSSYDGGTLGQRVGSINTGEFRAVNEDALLIDAGIDPRLATPEQRMGAKQELYSILQNRLQKMERHDEVIELKAKLDQSMKDMLEGDTSIKFDDIWEQAMELKAKKAKLAEDPNFGFTKRMFNDANTYIISTVFTPSTLVLNTVPSVVKTLTNPLRNWIVKGGPFDEGATKGMLTFYHTMYNNVDMAWQTARAAFDYERAIAATETYANKYMEGAQGTGIFDNRFGRALRLFPRLLAATDEFFFTLNYRGYVMAEAHEAAINAAKKAGLSSDEANNFIAKELQFAADHMYGQVEHRSDLIDWLTQTGTDKGFKGDKLKNWVKKELQNRSNLMKEATSRSGLDYTEDLLFRRKFSGETLHSKTARGFEKVLLQHPYLRTFGQLFFRTPIRVFEEGLRMTPGWQFVHPSFLSDLRGANGEAAYAKAMGQALTGFAIGQWVIMQYAMGNLTGAGPEDYKLRRDMENAGWESYTLKVGDKRINFRNLDPFATPVKIIVNSLEKLADLEYRKQQGDFEAHSQAKEIEAWLGVAFGSLGQAVRDANLTEGIHQQYDIAQRFFDPEDGGFIKALNRFAGQKAAYAIPSLFSKAKKIEHPLMADPVTAEQYIRAKINPASSLVAHQHDVLGNIRKDKNPWGALTSLRYTTEEMRKAGYTDKEIEVLKEVANLGLATGNNFVMPMKNKYVPGVDDLRTAYTKDGSKTLYDRANEILKQSDLTDALHSALVGSTAPTEVKTDIAKQLINNYREFSFVKLMQEETGMEDSYIRSKVSDAEKKAGVRDTMAIPNRID